MTNWKKSPLTNPSDLEPLPRVDFVKRDGLDYADRLVSYEEDDMAERKKNTSLSERQKQALYRQYLMGEKPADLAQSYNISLSTAYSHINDMRRKEGILASKEKVIAGDEKTGRLWSVDAGRHKFRGEVVMPDGELKTWDFTAINIDTAKQRWNKWKRDQDDERAFLDMCARKRTVTSDEPKAVCGYPDDPIEEIRPIKEVKTAIQDGVSETLKQLEESQKLVQELKEKIAEYESQDWVSASIVQNIIAERDALKARVEHAENAVNTFKIDMSTEGYDTVIANTELPEPKLDHWSNNNGAFRVVWTNKPVYVVWAKGDTPRLYAVYPTMERALKSLDELNEIASFLGSGDAFEVEEVQWKA